MKIIKIHVITDDQAAFDLDSKLHLIYGSFWYLLEGTAFALDIAQAYEDIEATEAVKVDGVALRWNETSFKKEPYDQIRKCFDDILSFMPNGEDVALMVFPQSPKSSIPQAPGNKGKVREVSEVMYEDDLATEAIETSHSVASNKGQARQVDEEVDLEGNPATAASCDTGSASKGKRKEAEGLKGRKHRKAKQT
ncbi:hypothetical protein C0995_003594 [Termitomyces sp. Mi166|nr:hypothetical protein C0995_003594 [Termitomyces sp. Mi166\